MPRRPPTLVEILQDFPTPLDLLLECDPDFRNHDFDPYNWQINFNEAFGNPKINKDNPFKATVVACNGSGKDKTIIAPCALWVCMTSEFGTSVITSASGSQLDKQTDSYIRILAANVNKYYDSEVVKINYRHYECLVTKGVIELFATDEAGRAEGWHPKTSKSKLAIFTSESKSIPNDLFLALHRCTGFSYRVDVSSPGPPQGHFFEACHNSAWNHYKVTAYECAHLGLAYIEETKAIYGEHSPFFKSMVLAEFATTEEPVVIPYHLLVAYKKALVPNQPSAFNTAGLDLAFSGGNESVLIVRNGNKVIAVESFHIADTDPLVSHLEHLFFKYQLDRKGAEVFADASGVGAPILSLLRTRNWSNLRFCFNQATATNSVAYENFGTEIWFNLKGLIETADIIIPLEDETFIKQLTNRYHTRNEKSKRVQVESKLKHRARGLESPDRADALTLCFAERRPEFSKSTPVTSPEAHTASFQQKLYVTPTLSSVVTDQNKNPLNIQITGPDNALGGARQLPPHLREELIALGYGPKDSKHTDGI